MKSLIIFFSFIVFSLNVMATQPGDEEFGSNNYFCKYERYKNKIPDACPRVKEIIYSITVYGNPQLQEDMQSYLYESILFYRNRSKNKDVVLKKDRSRLLSRSNSFKQSYSLYVPERDKLIVSFFVKVNIVGSKKFVIVNAVMGSSLLVRTAQDVGDLINDEELDKYIKALVDEYVKKKVSPVIFPDWEVNQF